MFSVLISQAELTQKFCAVDKFRLYDKNLKGKPIVQIQILAILVTPLGAFQD